MAYAPVLGLAATSEFHWLDVRTGYEKVISESAQGERGHVGRRLCTSSGQRASLDHTTSAATGSSVTQPLPTPPTPSTHPSIRYRTSKFKPASRFLLHAQKPKFFGFGDGGYSRMARHDLSVMPTLKD